MLSAAKCVGLQDTCKRAEYEDIELLHKYNYSSLENIYTLFIKC